MQSLKLILTGPVILVLLAATSLAVVAPVSYTHLRAHETT